LAEQLCDKEAFANGNEGISDFAKVLLLLHENAPTHFVARQSIFGRNLQRRVASLLKETSTTERTTVMKKTLLVLATVAILCAALFRVEFVAQETSPQKQPRREPATASPDGAPDSAETSRDIKWENRVNDMMKLTTKEIAELIGSKNLPIDLVTAQSTLVELQARRSDMVKQMQDPDLKGNLPFLTRELPLVEEDIILQELMIRALSEQYTEQLVKSVQQAQRAGGVAERNLPVDPFAPNREVTRSTATLPALEQKNTDTPPAISPWLGVRDVNVVTPPPQFAAEQLLNKLNEEKEKQQKITQQLQDTIRMKTKEVAALEVGESLAREVALAEAKLAALQATQERGGPDREARTQEVLVEILRRKFDEQKEKSIKREDAAIGIENHKVQLARANRMIDAIEDRILAVQTQPSPPPQSPPRQQGNENTVIPLDPRLRGGDGNDPFSLANATGSVIPTAPPETLPQQKPPVPEEEPTLAIYTIPAAMDSQLVSNLVKFMMGNSGNVRAVVEKNQLLLLGYKTDHVGVKEIFDKLPQGKEAVFVQRRMVESGVQNREYIIAPYPYPKQIADKSMSLDTLHMFLSTGTNAARILHDDKSNRHIVIGDRAAQDKVKAMLEQLQKAQ
jgi:hypothetical protein